MLTHWCWFFVYWNIESIWFIYFNYFWSELKNCFHIYLIIRKGLGKFDFCPNNDGIYFICLIILKLRFFWTKDTWVGCIGSDSITSVWKCSGAIVFGLMYSTLCEHALSFIDPGISNIPGFVNSFGMMWICWINSSYLQQIVRQISLKVYPN